MSTPGEGSPGPGGSDSTSREEMLLDAVADFVRLHEAGDPLAGNLDGFVGRYPQGLRVDLKRMCEAHRAVAGELDGPGFGGSGFGSSGNRSASSTGLDGEAGEADGHGPRRIGDFAIIEEIGRGGMGVVYLAEQRPLRRQVALKVLAPSFAFSSEHKERFRREAAAAAHLQHPGIVPIHSFGEYDGTLYYAMEFVAGRDLSQHIEAARESGLGTRRHLGLLPDAPQPVEIAEVVARIADALHYAHEQGIVHRDVKPSNILLGADGNPRVLDFGLAKNAADDRAVSRSGDLTGTPYYMSPEQTLARRAPVDHRTDVFSLGVILYELCTLQRPFVGEDLQQLVFQVCFGEPRPIHRVNPRIPRDLAVICAKAIEKDPRRRYSTAAAFAEDLRRFRSYRPVSARPAPPWVRTAKWLRRHRALAGTAALLLLALSAWGMFQWRESWRLRRDLAEALSSARADETAGRWDDAEATLRAALARSPENPAVVAALEAVLEAKDDAARDTQLQRLRAERLLTQSALELGRDPELALALAVRGTEEGERARLRGEGARLGDAAVVEALDACVRSVVLGSPDAGRMQFWAPLPGGPGVVGAGDGAVALWDLGDVDEPVRRAIPSEAQTAGAVAAAAEGLLLAIAEGEGRIGFWSLPELAPRGDVQTDLAQVQGIALSDAGTALALHGGGQGVRVYALGDDGWSEVWRLADSRLRPVALRFAPGRDALLVQGSSRELYVVDESGGVALHLDATPGPPLRREAGARWSLDGRSVIRVDSERSVGIYALESNGAPLRRFTCAAGIAALCVSDDGQIVGVGCEDHTARLWSLDDGRELRVISGHDGAVVQLAATGARGVVVSAGDDRVVAIHEIATGRRLARLPQPDRVTDLMVRDGGSLVLCRYQTQAPRVWAPALGRQALTIPAHLAPVNTVAVHPDADRLVTSGEDGTLRIWSLPDGALLGQRRVPGMAVADRWVGFGHDGGTLRVIASEHYFEFDAFDLEERDHVVMARPRTGTQGSLRRPGGRRRGAAHGAFGSEAAFVCVGGGLLRIGPSGGEASRTAEVIPAGDAPVRATAVLAPRGAEPQRLAVARGRDGLQLWDLGESGGQAVHVKDLSRHLGVGVSRIEASVTGRRWAVLRVDGVAVFDREGALLHEIPGGGRPATALAFDPADRWLALGYRDGTAEVVDLESGARGMEWRPHRDRIFALAVTPDGQRIVSAAADHLVRVWPVDPLAAARSFGVRPLRIEELERFGLLDDVHRVAKEAVDRLYEELVLTRDVLSALSEADLAEDVRGTAVRYARERPNPPADVLRQWAQQILDPAAAPTEVVRCLGWLRAAIRLQPRDADQRVVEALAHYRLGRSREALDVLAVAFGLGTAQRVRLGWAVHALASAELGRIDEARASLDRMRAARPRGPAIQDGTGPPSRLPNERGNAQSERHWIARARALEF